MDQRLVFCSEEKKFVLVYGMILNNYIAFAYFSSGCIYMIVDKMFPKDSGLNDALKKNDQILKNYFLNSSQVLQAAVFC